MFYGPVSDNKALLFIIIIIYNFSEEAELDGSTGKQDMA